MRITAKDSVCLIVDYQEKILPAIADRERLIENSVKLLQTSDLRDPDGHDGSIQQGTWREYPTDL